MILPRFSSFKSVMLGLAVAVAGAFPSICICPGSALAREINLGGQHEGNGAPAHKPRTAANLVELPPISVTIERNDGNWGRVTVSAWLAPDSVLIARAMTAKKSAIAKEASEGLSGVAFQDLQSAHYGAQAAKDAIHAAAERTLGYQWSGEVLIGSMLVY